MATSLYTIVSEISYRLGDSSQQIWAKAEVEGYVKEGYEDLTLQTLCFWKVGYLDLTQGLATYDLPEDLYKIDRITYDNTRLEVLRSRQVRYEDSQYQTEQGEIEGYLVEQDGLRTIRFWRVPSEDSQPAATTGTWGIPRLLTDVTSATITPTSAWGIPRGTEGMFDEASPDSAWGIPRQWRAASSGLKIEYFYRPPALDAEQDFEIEDRFTKYVTWFGLWKSLERESPGQDMELAEHYKSRYLVGLSRVLKRKQEAHSSRIGILGRSGKVVRSIPRPSLPWQYGKMTRR